MIEHLARAAAELQMKRNGRKCTQDGLLNSPPLKPEQVLQYNKTSSSSSPAKKPPPPSSPPPSYHQEGGPAAVAPWSKAEQSKFQEAVQKFGEQEPAKIANYMGTRSEAQIRAHIMNMKASQADQGTQEETPKKHKGRGRKPPTTAMNTVPNANFDVKSMLKNLGNNAI